jgi:arylsulfatase A-like enzyme
MFQTSGYATGAVGKWGLGPVGSTGDPNRQGFDQFFGYNCQAAAHSYYPARLWRNAEAVPLNARAIPGHQRQPEGEVRLDDWIGGTYAPAVMVAEAEAFIRAHADRPFFLFLPFIEPHVAMHPPGESVERFPADWDTRPYRGENGYLPHPRPRAGYAAMISDLDAHVGRVLAALEAQGLADRTLVVFTSDNGPTHPGQPGTAFHIGGADPVFFESTAGLRGYKGSVYEGGLRVPLIARLPGRIPAGRVSDAPGYFADWFATLAEAAGLAPPGGLDGESLWPVLTGGEPAPRAKPMLWVFPEYGGQVAVRIGEMKLVRQRLKTAAPGPWEVYDLRRDPAESTDLAAAHPKLIAEAEALLGREVADNPLFPVPLPGVIGAAAPPVPPAR